jgi:hypothetical protein
MSLSISIEIHKLETLNFLTLDLLNHQPLTFHLLTLNPKTLSSTNPNTD